MRRTLMVAASLAAASSVALSGVPATASSPSASRLLTITELPDGWSVTYKATTGVTTPLACVRAYERAPRGVVARAKFVKGELPGLIEELTTDRGAGFKRWGLLRQELPQCKTFTISDGGKTESGSIGALSLPRVGTASVAYAVTVSETGSNTGVNLVLFHAGAYYGLLGYADRGTPSVTPTVGFAREAVAKAEGKPATPSVTMT